MSVAFTLGEYRLPFTTIAVHTHEHNHTHHSPDGWTWKEKMILSFHVLAINPFRVTVANDNEDLNEDQSHSPA